MEELIAQSTQTLKAANKLLQELAMILLRKISAERSSLAKTPSIHTFPETAGYQSY